MTRAVVIEIMRRAIRAWKREHVQRLVDGKLDPDQIVHVERGVIDALAVTVIAGLGEGEVWFRKQIERIVNEEAK
jgi:hypothetical protein